MMRYPELQSKVGSLCASGYEKNGSQEVWGGMYVIEQTYWDGNDIVGTLTLSNAGGAQRMPDKDNFNRIVMKESDVYTQNDDKCYTIDAHYNQVPGCRGGLERTVIASKVYSTSKGGFHLKAQEEKTDTLMSSDYKDPVTVAYAVDLTNFEEDEVNGTVKSSAAHNTESNNVVRVKYIVRRLTELECTRLQGFPDGHVELGDWKDSKGRIHKDSSAPKYKALGNSISIPNWTWIIGRLCDYLPEGATMCSLFDGIGGFPLIWERINGKGTCLWASEIEEFPMAVTRERFGDKND